MSIMSDLADEVLKPVRIGLFVTSAVIVVGGLAIGANSKKGRKFLKNVKNAILTKEPETSIDHKVDEKADEVIIDVTPEDNPNVPVIEAKPKDKEDEKDLQKQKMIGENNV